MSTDRDFTRVVRSWLRTDEHESADRVLDIVLDLLDTTPQRRSWWSARRSTVMNTYDKLAIAAAAVVVVAIVGFNLLPGNGQIGGPAATPTPVPTPVPTPSPSATPELAFPASGELTVGRHTTIQNGIRLSLDFTTPAWLSNGSWGIDKGPVGGAGSAGFIFWDADIPVGVFNDPCHEVEGPPAGPSTAERAAAVASLPGAVLVSGPADVTIGGYPAKLTVIKIPEDAPCPRGERGFNLWYSTKQ